MKAFFLASLLSALFFTGITAAGQTPEPPKTALERSGLYHADIEGRFVSPDGAPVAGVHVQVNGGRPGALPLVDVVTGPDGKFAIRDVSSSYIPDLRWYPPEQWLRGGIAIAGESGSKVNVGTITLQRDTAVRVTLELVGGPPLDSRDLQPSLILKGKSEYGPRIVAQDAGLYRVVRQIPFDEGAWEISLYTKGRLEKYEAPFRVEHGRRDQLLRLSLLRDTLKMEDRYGGKGSLEVQEATLPSTTIEREFRARGRVLAPDGSPIPGAVVAINDVFREVMPQWTVSDADGGFDIKYTALTCQEPVISNYLQIRDFNSKEECESRWSSPRDLAIDVAAHLVFQTEGVDAASVRAYKWNSSFGWTEFSSLRPWFSLRSYPPPLFKVDTPGHLPLAQITEVPFVQFGKKPPPETPVLFRYDSSERILAVRANGMPILNATVDVEKIENLTKNTRIQLGTYNTSSTGELRLAGGADQLVEVFVYADGYEPRRAIWPPNNRLTVDLTPRDATLSFTAQAGAVLARIRPVTNPGAVMTANLTIGTQIPLAPGDYDITTYNNRGTVLGYQRISLKAAETKIIDPSVDERPRLTVRFPTTGWRSEVNESTPRGGSVNWIARIAVVGTLQLNDVPATPLQSSPQEDVYLLSRAGRMQVQVQREGFPILWREIAVRPNESLTIEVPAAQATLEAPSNFDPGKGHTHGIAGPRMQLIADDPSGWSITEFVPNQKKKGTFTIAGIPPGDYHLFHHLFNGKLTYIDNGKTRSYDGTPAAWGGVGVHLVAGKTTRIAALNTKLGNLSVRVSDSAGRPINNATLRIRDRMSDSWRQVEENPAVVEQAGLPIPYPTAVRVVDGKAALSQIRSGWLDFAVETDAGPAYSYTMPVVVGQELRVTIP